MSIIRKLQRTPHRPTRVGVILVGALVALAASGPAAAATERATFAGGCFWCLEPPYDKLEGVLETISGYAGGKAETATYKMVSSGNTGHYEVLQVVYDPDRVSYGKLLEVFLRNVDPTDDGGQFCDRGPQYRTAVFAHDSTQRAAAEAALARLRGDKPFADPVVTPVLDLEGFYPAEEYHQDYYTKNPVRYKFYRYSCGRDKRLEALWGTG